MIERDLLIRFANDFVQFANRTAEDDQRQRAWQSRVFDPSDAVVESAKLSEADQMCAWLAQSGTPKAIANLSRKARRHCALLSRWFPSKSPNRADPELVRIAQSWLDWSNGPDPRGSTSVYWSMTEGGEVQLRPQFVRMEDLLVVTFAELISTRTPVVIRRCKGLKGSPGACGKFFVNELGVRRRPWEHCPAHRHNTKASRNDRVRRHRKHRGNWK